MGCICLVGQTTLLLSLCSGGLCASPAGAPWSLGLSDSVPHLRALPSEGWASAPSSCWKSNIKEDVRETRTERHEEGRRGERWGGRVDRVYPCLAQCLHIVELN